MASKLRLRDFIESEIQETIAKLVEQKYLQEEEFIKSRIRVLGRKGKSNEYIRRQCKKEELEASPELIKQTLQDAGISQEENVTALIQKKMRQLGPIPTDKKEAYLYYAKIARFLLSRGHRPPTKWSQIEYNENS